MVKKRVTQKVSIRSAKRWMAGKSLIRALEKGSLGCPQRNYLVMCLYAWAKVNNNREAVENQYFKIGVIST
jgi:hypothetical protein